MGEGGPYSSQPHLRASQHERDTECHRTRPSLRCGCVCVCVYACMCACGVLCVSASHLSVHVHICMCVCVSVCVTSYMPMSAPPPPLCVCVTCATHLLLPPPLCVCDMCSFPPPWPLQDFPSMPSPRKESNSTARRTAATLRN